MVVFSLRAASFGESVVLTWNDNSDNEDGFNIERAIGDGAFEEIGQVGADVATFTDTTAQAGVNYKYRVNAFNAFGYSGYTNVASHYINVAPAITDLSDVSVEENSSTDALSFSVSDFETASAELSVSVVSSNIGLVDEAGILLQGTGAERSLTLSPKLNSSGESTITVTVSDGVDSASASFLFSVNSFVPPSLQLEIDAIAAQPRAGEAFVLSSNVSDASIISGISYLLGDELLDSVAAAPYDFSLTIAEPGSYTVKAVATLTGRDQTISSSLQIEVGEAPTDSTVVDSLATLSADETSASGSANYDLARDIFRLEDEKGEIAGTSDTHRFYYLMAEGDLVLETQLIALDTSSSTTVAGVMLRSALFGKSAHASLLVDRESGIAIRTRAARGAATQERAVGSSSSSAPWLRIEKTGSQVRYLSKAKAEDQWTLLGTDAIALGDRVFLGFALAGAAAEGTVAAEFASADFQGAIVALGEDAVKPNIPSGLLISSLGD